MSRREGQVRVEHHPGQFIWMTEADAKAWEAAHPKPEEPEKREGIEAAVIEPPETATLPRPKSRAKPKR